MFFKCRQPLGEERLAKKDEKCEPNCEPRSFPWT